MKKKLFSIIAAGTMAISLLAGCSKNAEETQTLETTTQAVAVSQESAAAQPVQAAKKESNSAGTGGKTLIVYYSATGNTKQVATTIKDITGGELFELQPVEPYSEADLDWTDDSSRVSREHDDPQQRAVELASAVPEDWESVSVVYVGYPIWWGVAAWPVDSFVKANDFTGKTVIPFCTSASSGMGESGGLLAEMAGTGDWKAGMRFGAGVPKADIQAWIEGMGPIGTVK